ARRRTRRGRGGRARPRRARGRAADGHAVADARRRLAAPARRGRARLGARVRIALIGGTGAFGKALGRRLVEAGAEVVVGSRDAARAAEVAAEIGAAGGATNEDAV